MLTSGKEENKSDAERFVGFLFVQIKSDEEIQQMLNEGVDPDTILKTGWKITEKKSCTILEVSH